MNKITYTPNDLNYMNYHEFGIVTQILISKLQLFSNQTGIYFDAVVPILRSGGVIGSIVAISLKIFNFIPLQLKYDLKRENIATLFNVPEIEFNTKTPNILICDVISKTGKTAIKAIENIKKVYPNANLYFAVNCQTYGSIDQFENIKKYFYAIETDDFLKLDIEEAINLKIRRGYTVFPWENPIEELKYLNNIN